MARTKRILAVVMAASILLGTASVFAAENGVSYTSPSGEYTAQKMSHPDAGLGEVDGIIEYDNGKNDRGQNYSWSAVGYGDYMYVGTCYAAIYSTVKIMAQQSGTDIELFKAGLNALYNGTLYLGDPENNPGDANRSILVRVNMRTGEVKEVIGPRAIGGYRAATAFNGKLYFASAALELIEIDPSNNDATQVVYQCAKPSDPFISVGIRGLTSVNGKLVASMIGDDGAYIVASSDPSAGQDSFQVIATQEDMLDYPAYHYNDSIFGGSVWDMIGFNNKLYFTVVTGKNGQKQAFALFCGEENAETGEWTYRLLVGDEKDGARYPFGFGADRSGAGNLIVHDGYLYIGGYNDPMVALPKVLQMDFEELYKDLDSPVNLWRMDANENFELVAGEPNEYFPEVVGNMGSGFGSNLNQYVWRMESYDGKLYVGTFDIGSLAYPVMQFTNGDIFDRTPEEWKTQIQYILDLIKLIAGGDKQVAATRSAGVLNELESLSTSMTDLGDLLNKGGVNDLDATEQFYELLQKIVSIYNSIRDYLPDWITNVLDGILNQDKIDAFYYFLGTCKYLSKGERGFDLLVSEDGVNFEVITRDGFGDPYNHGCRVFAITDAGLCLGTANPFYGTQLWRLSDLTAEEPDTSEPDTGDTTEPDTGDVTEPGTGDVTNPSEGPGTDDSTAPDTDPSTGSVDGTDADAEPDSSAPAGTQDDDSSSGGASVGNPDTGDLLAGGACAALAAVAGGTLIVLSFRKKK